MSGVIEGCLSQPTPASNETAQTNPGRPAENVRVCGFDNVGLVWLPRAGLWSSQAARGGSRERSSAGQQPLPFGQGQAVVLAQLHVGLAAPA